MVGIPPGDLATGLFDFDSEVEALSNHLEGDEVPSEPALWRTELYWAKESRLKKDQSSRINYLSLEFGRHIKLFSDGLLQSVGADAGAWLHRWTYGEWLAA